LAGLKSLPVEEVGGALNFKLNSLRQWQGFAVV